MTIRLVLFFVAILFLVQTANAATWYVRDDGGTAQQCTGRADAPYPGSGSAQPCAFNNWYYLFGNDTPGEAMVWKIAGGDAVIVGDPSATNPGKFRIGPKGASGASADTWAGCYSYGCFNPTIPSGTPANPTKIYGRNYAAQGTKTQLFGGYSVRKVLNLEGAQYVDIRNLEITDHAECARIGNSNQCVSSFPADDYALIGISFDTATAHIQAQDLDIHGLAGYGLFGPIGGDISLTDVRISANPAAGWDLDSGVASTGGVVTMSKTTFEFAGCMEQYPIINAIPIAKCWDDNSGGYGDAIGTHDGDAASFVIDHSIFRYSTQDGPDLLHSNTPVLVFQSSESYGNMGQQLKVGAATQVTVRNSLITDNCKRMSMPLLGAPANYNGALSDFCRAAGAWVGTSWGGAGTSVEWSNNTFVGYGATFMDIGCKNGPCNAGLKIFRNNIVYAYTNPNLNAAQAPGSFYYEDGTADGYWTSRSNNIYFGFRRGTPCPTNFANERCVEPLLSSTPPWVDETTLDSLVRSLEPLSPAIDAGASAVEFNDDFVGNLRGFGGGWDIGAYEFNTSGPTPSPTPTVPPSPAPTPTPSPVPVVVWVEDALPLGSTVGGDSEGWTWITGAPTPFSGTRAHQSASLSGLHQHYFFGTPDTLSVTSGDLLFAYVYLDPNDVPSEVMLQWREPLYGWEHRAYWGSDDINWLGTLGTDGRRFIGQLPTAGGWVRLEVPASLVGLEGRSLDGMAFSAFGGRATWDRAGKASQTSPTPSPTPTPTPSSSPTLRNRVEKAERNGQDLSNYLVSANGPTGPSGTSGSPMDQSATIALAEFVSEIQEAYAVFNDNRNLYPAAPRIDVALQAAFVAASQAGQAAIQGDLVGVKSHLREAINNLELSYVLIRYGDVSNPIDFASYMVRQDYVDFLNREPDQSGGDFWINQIASCGTDTHCVEVKRINVSAAFFLSIEFQQTGYYVHRLYKSSYGRVPVRQEFLPDNLSIVSGVIVGADGWEARLAGNKQAFVQAWVQRADFQARYAGLTNEQYIDALIANVGVTITAAERDDLVQDLVNGKSRADVLGKLVENPTFTRGEFNSAFVLMQYFGYLRRDPDTEGFNFWLRKLNQFDGNFVDAEMVKAFLQSTEYRRRFGL